MLHQVREPVAVVRSLMRMRFFHRPSRDPDYVRFAVDHFPELASGPPLERCLKYWVGWNRLAECAAHVEGLRYYRYRLEDLGPSLLREVLEVVGHSFDATGTERALRELPDDCNTRGDLAEDAGLTWRTFPEGEVLDQVRELAAHYGYTDPTPTGTLTVASVVPGPGDSNP